MSRTLTSGMNAVTTDEIVRPVYLVRMVFDATEVTNELNMWSGLGDLVYDGETYLGVGDLLSISSVKETADISASGLNVMLSGVKSSLVAVAKNQDYQGRPLTLSFGAFNDSGDLVADPVVVFSGFMDTMTIAETGDYSTISIAVENKLIAFERSKIRRYTAEDQKIDHPTDKGFEFVASIGEKEIVWGRPTGTSQAGVDDDDDGGATKAK